MRRRAVALAAVLLTVGLCPAPADARPARPERVGVICPRTSVDHKPVCWHAKPKATKHHRPRRDR